MTSTPQPLDLAAIKARAEAATPGPWIAFSNRLFQRPNNEDRPDLMKASGGGACWIIENADAAFIAHARTDVPALVAEVERLRDQRPLLVTVAEDGTSTVAEIPTADDIAAIRAAAAKIVALKAEVERLRKALEVAKREHDTCEDRYYSCPLSSDGPWEPTDKPECNCGADAHNARIAKALEGGA